MIRWRRLRGGACNNARNETHDAIVGSQVQPFDEAAVDAATAAVWRQVWPAQRLRQREFFSFGMEVLLKLDLQVRVYCTAWLLACQRVGCLLACWQRRC